MSRIVYDPDQYDFSETSFIVLMQQRIRKVLLICSNYDSFILEEDGRIDEQIFNEYASLNLRYPPVFIQTNSAEEAHKILQEEKIDLIIEMLNIKDRDAFMLARELKSTYPKIPIVVLTHFSREVSIRLQNEDLSAIDYVFSWLGNSDILLAIIKLIEDEMNVETDVKKVGVQVILLIEDSIRYTSSYLPILYKTIYNQSREFMKEGLNEHQKMLRMRGRPKIVLAKTYDEAWALYNKYKSNILGIISDVSYKKNAKERDTEKKTGMLLCKRIRDNDPFLPILLQSSDITNAPMAAELEAGFLHKYSKNLSNDLRDYIRKSFAFGDFVFVDPVTREEVGRAASLKDFQEKIVVVPDEVLFYHTSREDFSRWLNARALFPIAKMFKAIKTEDFDNLDRARLYLYRAIGSFRAFKGRGVIGQFEKDKFDKYLLFSRIGDGSIGGKARGLAFINFILKKYKLSNKFDNVLITVPRSVVLSTEIFEEFMELNNLYEIGLSDIPDEEILDKFAKAELPEYLLNDLKRILEVTEKPLAVRSSSKLEDSNYQPFAGIYSTYMIPNPPSDKKQTLELLTLAIKSVYASVYFKESKLYISATSNLIDEEKMGIIIQEICGNYHKGYYYPTISGVARSVNFYPIAPEKYEEGVCNIAYGLGKYIVNGGLTIRFSPKHPHKIIQLSSPDYAIKQTQNKFYALNLNPEKFELSTDDSVNLELRKLKEAENDLGFKHVASTYDHENNVIRDGIFTEGKRILTFVNVLQNNIFPLADILATLMQIGQDELNNPIEIEFAVNLETSSEAPFEFNFLQVRPIVEREVIKSVDLTQIKDTDTILISKKALGNGGHEDIFDVVYVKTESFSASNNKLISEIISKINDSFILSKSHYILIGPGRWGSADPWLGIPVSWPKISQAIVIVESGLQNYRIDPSQGTHFFHNLTNFGVSYLTINPFENDGYYDINYLNSIPAVYEDEYIRHITTPSPLKVMVDGKKGHAVVLK